MIHKRYLVTEVTFGDIFTRLASDDICRFEQEQ